MYSCHACVDMFHVLYQYITYPVTILSALFCRCFSIQLRTRKAIRKHSLQRETALVLL